VPVQFDEREEETEQRQTGLRRPGENLTNCHREAKATAPLLDSTHIGNLPMFTKKKRQISTWKLALMAATCVAGVAGGGVPGLIVVIVLVSIVGLYLIWTKL
jgi:hypothetical protein